MHTRFLPFLLCVVVACGGGSPGLETPAQGTPGVPPPNPAPNPGPLPPNPTPQPEVVYDHDFIDLTKAGAFPSDLVSDGQGSLYSVNDAQIPADDPEVSGQRRCAADTHGADRGRRPDRP